MVQFLHRRFVKELLVVLALLTIVYALFFRPSTYDQIKANIPPQFLFDSHFLFDSRSDSWALNPVTQTYELDGKPIIWQYWNSDHIPLYVGLFVESLQCRNPEFRIILVQDSTLYKYLPDFKLIKPLFDILIGAHKADLFRVAALAKYGGLYVDVDVFALEKFYPLYQLLEKYDMVSPNWGNEILSMGQLGPARAGLPLFQKWHQNQLNAIKAKVGIDGTQQNSDTNDTITQRPLPKTDPFQWIELLYGRLIGLENMVINDTRYRRYKGSKTVGQLVVRGLEQSAMELFDRESHKFLPLRWSPILYLHHSKLKAAYTNVTDLNVLLPQVHATLYSAFVGCALMDCWTDFEKLAAVNQSAVTPIAKANVANLMAALGRMDPSICQKINARDGLFTTVELDL